MAWFGCACCPPNIARLLASLGELSLFAGRCGLAVHLYVQGETTIDAGRRRRHAAPADAYPWDGKVRLTWSCPQPPRMYPAPAHPGLVPAGRSSASMARPVAAPVEAGMPACSAPGSPATSSTLTLDDAHRAHVAHPESPAMPGAWRCSAGRCLLRGRRRPRGERAPLPLPPDASARRSPRQPAHMRRGARRRSARHRSFPLAGYARPTRWCRPHSSHPAACRAVLDLDNPRGGGHVGVRWHVDKRRNLPRWTYDV